MHLLMLIMERYSDFMMQRIRFHLLFAELVKEQDLSFFLFFKAFSCELCALSCEWFRFSQFIYGHPIHLLLLSMNNLFTYCQFHIFQVLIIEVNTVPGMTPSTVLIHQVITNSQIHILFQQLRLFWCPMEIWLS